MQRLIDLIDFILTIIFWPFTKLLGIEKCSKCTIRIRTYQFLLLITWPLSLFGLLKELRIKWDIKTITPSYDKIDELRLVARQR